MGILTKLKSVLGMGAETTVEAEATVEREPAGVETADTEAADAGAAEATEPDASGAGDAGSATETDSGGAATNPVQDIKGVGPAYAEQLADAGVETVGDLAAAEPAELAERTSLSAARIENWVEQARART